MNITLTPQQEDFIAAQVASGKYTNADKVVSKALTVLEKLQAEYQDWLEETRAKVDVGISELERGKGLDGEMVMTNSFEQFAQVKAGLRQSLAEFEDGQGMPLAEAFAQLKQKHDIPD
ncbi:MAG: type II toxin-antitoxin system ParD family antitoxin [Cyanobacteria bacterium P01_G01_bin.54]